MSLEPTLRPTLTQSASRMLRIREVSPSPLSLASQHLQTKLYMTPLVGTTMVSSSTSQQLSGVAPSCPTCENQQETTCLLKGISSETPIGCFNQWWRAKSVDYIHRHTNHFCGGTEGAVKSFMPLLPNRQDISVHSSWCGRGSSGHQLLNMGEGWTPPVPKESEVDWTDLHENMSSLLLLYFYSIDLHLLVCWSLQALSSTFPTLPLLLQCLEATTQSFVANMKDAATQTPTCIIQALLPSQIHI